MTENSSGPRTRQTFRRMRMGLGLLLLLASGLSILAASSIAEQRAATEIYRKSSETLSVQAETLSGVLEKYRLLPPLLARQDDIAALYLPALPLALRAERARRRAEQITGLSGARDVVFFEPDGRVLASARGAIADLTAARAGLLETARQGRLGRATVALNSGDRAYAFSAGIRRHGEFLGAVAIYVSFDSIEATWSLSNNPIFVSDNTGTIFLTNRSQWRLKKLTDIVDLDEETGFLRSHEGATVHADISRALPLLGWQLHILGDRAPIEAASLWAAATAFLACLSVSMFAFFLLHRRELAIMRNRRDRATALRLERIIRDRTKVLSLTNNSLSKEITERRQAETKLKMAQAELIQSAKLAVLGQMSAALSHELNQPLAALKTYAANTTKLIAARRLDQASDNLGRIGAMVDRMAELSSALLSFSRKPGTTTTAVLVGQILHEALILVSPRARNAKVVIDLDASLRDISVMGGRIRLSQVFVNLINNSIDALEGQPDGRIAITLQASGRTVAIEVADNGPGIPGDLRSSVFEPFFTTKQIGSGIGIGLSIAYNIVHDFGGRIDLVDRQDRGCAFLVTLVAASHAVPNPE